MSILDYHKPDPPKSDRWFGPFFRFGGGVIFAMTIILKMFDHGDDDIICVFIGTCLWALVYSCIMCGIAWVRERSQKILLVERGRYLTFGTGMMMIPVGIGCAALLKRLGNDQLTDILMIGSILGLPVLGNWMVFRPREA